MTEKEMAPTALEFNELNRVTTMKHTAADAAVGDMDTVVPLLSLLNEFLCFL